MTLRDEEIRQRLRIGEDSRWEFKQVEFSGDRPTRPSRADLADEMIAFANAEGGILLCGVTDDGEIQGMSRRQLTSLSGLLTEVSTDSVDPALRIEVFHRELHGRALAVVGVPKGDSLFQRSGRSFIRVGASKRQMTGDERLRLAQRRAQSRYLWFDRQPLLGTGAATLSERLWEPLLSATAAADPIRGLTNLGLIRRDEAGALRATVAGVLLCTENPHDFLPCARIMATCYRGKHRASGQFDGQEITGPLQRQIAEATRFVARNMRVAARKTPAREEVPQYSAAAVFEAIVNAVVHRDYSVAARQIRVSMFSDRLEIDSPGGLPNGMTVAALEASQATRNEALASVFGRIAVGNMSGSDHRQFLMERRGDGVPIILRETQETAGVLPKFDVVDGSNVVLTIPAAKLQFTPADATVGVYHDGEPLPGIDVLVLYPNKTWRRARTDEVGDANFDLHSTHLPLTVYAAAPGYCGKVERKWIPQQGGCLVELSPLSDGGSAIFPRSEGNLPGLHGRLNPILDTHGRTYLYADNIAIEQGRQQPVYFRMGRALRLTDAYGVEMSVRILDIVGNSSLVEYRKLLT